MTGLRHVGPLKVKVELELTVSGSAVVHYSGKADSGFVTHAITSEGVDVVGELPTETMLHLQDAVEASAEIDERALIDSPQASATRSSLILVGKTPTKGAVNGSTAPSTHPEGK